MSSQSSLVSTAGQHLGLVVGLAVTAMSMSSGFIWASQSEIGLVYVAGFFSWTGYLFAHYAAIGVFVDDVDVEDANGNATADDADDESGDLGQSLRQTATAVRAIAPENTVRAIGFVAGIVILVSGIAILAWFVRQENHLLGNLGSGMFLGGYVIAHYFDSGKPL